MRLGESDKYFSLAGRQAFELNFEEALLEVEWRTRLADFTPLC